MYCSIHSFYDTTLYARAHEFILYTAYTAVPLYRYFSEHRRHDVVDYIVMAAVSGYYAIRIVSSQMSKPL